MKRKLIVSPYDYDERKYFNTAAGTRATDRNHQIAQLAFERMKDLEREKRGIRKIAQEGFETAERTRALVAQMLGCKPRNIVFGNSASLLAMLLLRILFEEFGKNNVKVIYHSDSQYPTVILPFVLSRKKIKDILTMQNYSYAPRGHTVLGADPLMQILISEEMKSKMKDVHLVHNDDTLWSRPIWEIVGEDTLKWGEEHTRFVANGLIWDAINELTEVVSSPIISLSAYSSALDLMKTYDGEDALLHHFFLAVLDRVNRYNGTISSFLAIDQFEPSVGWKFGYTDNPLVLVDGSHSFGVIDFASENCNLPLVHNSPFVPAVNSNAYIATSSKTLGAEPTIGVMYVNDELLKLFKHYLPSFYPKVAFQFSPKISLGVKAVDVERTKHWFSIPELSSFEVALTELEKLGPEKHLKELIKIRTKLFHGLSRLRRYGIIAVQAEGEKDVETIESDSNDLDLEYYADESGDRIAHLPNYICVNTGKFDSDRIKDLLEEKGYVIESFNGIPMVNTSSYTSYTSNSHLRISFRFGVDYDIEGFLEAFESVVETLRAEKKYEKKTDDFPFL